LNILTSYHVIHHIIKYNFILFDILGNTSHQLAHITLNRHVSHRSGISKEALAAIATGKWVTQAVILHYVGRIAFHSIRLNH
jgi:hypothetical protein